MIQESLAHYRVLGKLGAGGMGEVYRAEDTKLKREVAIKVLPEAFAKDAERMRRLEREAQVLASLNHPNIAAIHGLEESDGERFLVLELAEGEDLAERLSRGAIPVDEAVQIARQMAEGLEQAHEKGIIHRDLKPANVKVSQDGLVKILDFGLAKALAGDIQEDSSSKSQSPTLARPATVAGVILGTPAYMSPEQARGKTIDRRSDIWAFGLVLYEMLTGRRPLEDETEEASFDALPGTTPPSIRRLLRRCLQRDPKRRLQAIGEARIQLEDALEGTIDEGRSRPVWFPWALASLAIALALLSLWAPWRDDAPPPPVVRTSTELGIDVQLTESGSHLSLSPDGSLLAFVGRNVRGDPSQIYLRRLDQLEARPLSDTEGAYSAFFSPDGQSIGFFAGGKLKRVSVEGGAAVALADVVQAQGGTWTEDGAIVFDPGRADAGLLQVSAAGGPPEVLTERDPGDQFGQRWPQVLPGGRGVLFTTFTEGSTGLVLQPLPRGPRKVVVRRGSYGHYLPSGHVTYWDEGTVFAVPFDLERLETTGAAVPILEDVASPLAPRYAFSDRGTVVYLSGYIGAHPIEWLTKGNLSPLRSEVDFYKNLRFSPDGRKLAMDISDGRQPDVWVYEWEREAMTRLTFDRARDENPIWTPDGGRIVFRSHRQNPIGAMYWEPADGTGDAQLLIGPARSSNPLSWHPSGKYFAFGSFNEEGSTDQMILPVEGDETSTFTPGEPFAFLNGPFNERWLAFSPDGAWAAYSSDESGRFEVYVRPFPGPGGKWPVSAHGGTTPTWSSNGRELFYESLDRRLMVVTYSVRGDSFEAEKPRLWSEVQLADLLGGRAFDLHPDGERFAILRDDESRQTRVVLILNFFDELRRLAPPGK